MKVQRKSMNQLGKIHKNLEKDKLEKIRNKNWYRHGVYRENILIDSTFQLGLDKKFFSRQGLNRNIRNLIQTDRGAYLVEEEFEEIVDLILNKLENDKNYLKKYIKDYNEDNKIFLSYSVNLSNKDFLALSNDRLSLEFEGFIKAMLPLVHWLWGMEHFNAAFDRYINNRISKWRPELSAADKTEFIASISFLKKKFPFQEEKKKLLSLNKNDRTVLKKMFKEYAWFNMYGWDGRPFTYSEYFKRVTKLISNKDKISIEVENHKRDSQKATKLISGIKDENIASLLKITQDLIYLKTQRIDVFTISWYHAQGLVGAIKKRLEISLDQLVDLTSEEIVTLLRKGSKPNINARKRFAILRINDKPGYYFGKAAKDIKEILNRSNDLDRVEGSSAFKGKVIGKAKLLMTDKDLSKLEKGDILISNMTNPNYNPAFKIIAGVVTDEGGVLCHSAIMAREFRIPCVIGTKIATSVFKDGDLIEVNAIDGVVKKI